MPLEIETNTAVRACSNVEAVGKRPSAVRQPHGPEQCRRAAFPSSLVTAAYFSVRLIPQDFFTFASLGAVPTPSGRVPGFGSLASGHFSSASQKGVFRQSRYSYVTDGQT